MQYVLTLVVMYCVSRLDTLHSLYDLGHFALPKVCSFEGCIIERHRLTPRIGAVKHASDVGAALS